MSDPGHDFIALLAGDEYRRCCANAAMMLLDTPPLISEEVSWLTIFILDWGHRHGVEDTLLPAAEQDRFIAAAMERLDNLEVTYT